MLRIKKYISIIIIGLLVSCSEEIKTEGAHEHTQDENEVEFTKEQFKTAQIQVGNIEQKTMNRILKVNGVLDVPPQNIVSISTIFGGTIKSTDLLEGMKVRKGQVIASIQNPDFIEIQQNYLDYKSQLDYLELEYDRQKDLTDVNAKKTLQKAKSEYESMFAKVQGMKARLNLLNISTKSLEKGNIQSSISITSPISGYVTKVNTNIGSFVTPSDVLFRIADTEHLHAELTVFEKDIQQVKIGQKVRFLLANGDLERKASVYLIGREINENRSVNIHCHLDKEDKELIPGMYLSALIECSSNIVSAIPSKSIVEFEGKKYIFIQNQTMHKGELIFKMVEVNIGIIEGDYTEIRTEMNLENEKIVIQGAYDILSKMKNSDSEGH